MFSKAGERWIGSWGGIEGGVVAERWEAVTVDGGFWEYEVREGENPTCTGRGLWGRRVIIYSCARELREFCDEGGGGRRGVVGR